MTTTKTDLGAIEWAINDEVSQLRPWATDTVHSLPDASAGAWDIGAAEDCALQLVDESGQLSRHHARLEREIAGWVVRDLGSKNGIRMDGARRRELLLQPGVELGIGGLALIAESPRLVALRQTGGNMSAAADMLGMSAVSLRAWLGRRELPAPP